MIKQPPAASPPVLDQKIPNLRRQFVAYWVNTAIKRGTQEKETKMAEQPVCYQIARPRVIPNMERPKWHTGYPI